MHVLVTGGAGYLGSILAHRLLDEGHRVRVLDSLLQGREALAGLADRSGFSFVEGDVRRSADVVRALEGTEAVVHLAAIVGDPACARQPALAVETNREASLRLFDEARGRGIERFLFASTCSNYGRMADPTEHVSEESELRPVSLYAETKVAVEEALLAEAAAGARPAVTLLRFATLYGPSHRMRFDLTVNEFTMELWRTRELVVYGEQFWRPYVHVADAARAVEMVLAADDGIVEGQVFNVGDTSENYRKGQLVEMVAEAMEREVRIERVEKDEDPRDYRVSFRKVRDRLGFAVTRTVPDGIREVLRALERGDYPEPNHARYRN